MNELEDVNVAAERLGKTPDTIRKWIRMGCLEGERVGRFYVVAKDAEPDPVTMPQRGNPNFNKAVKADFVQVIDECL